MIFPPAFSHLILQCPIFSWQIYSSNCFYPVSRLPQTYFLSIILEDLCRVSPAECITCTAVSIIIASRVVLCSNEVFSGCTNDDEYERTRLWRLVLFSNARSFHDRLSEQTRRLKWKYNMRCESNIKYVFRRSREKENKNGRKRLCTCELWHQIESVLLRWTAEAKGWIRRLQKKEHKGIPTLKTISRN